MFAARPILRLLTGGLLLLASCRGCGQQEAAPVKVSEQAPLIEPKTLPPRTGPFSNPDKDPPKERVEPQLPADELAAVLAKADGFLAKDQHLPAIGQLDRCANKVPQNVACEAKLGVVLAETKRRKAHAVYYLEQAAMAVPPELDTDLYRRIGGAALKLARFAAAEAALGIVVARKEATAKDYGDYATAVQGAKSSIDLAIDAYLQGYALDPTQTVWLREASTLLAQSGDNERALEVLKQYAGVASLEGKPKKMLEQRIAELEGSLAKPKPQRDAQ